MLMIGLVIESSFNTLLKLQEVTPFNEVVTIFTDT